jgi:stage II sporulation protein R
VKIKKWELSLALALMLSVLLGSFWVNRAEADARQLSDKLLRLHVVANSDSPEDQALKLIVRDRILESATDWVGNASGSAEASRILYEHRDELSYLAHSALRESGYDYPVRIEIKTAHFPTKEYNGFALPAGRYQALRVIIGEGAGQNWWCVVFPPLCVSAAQDTFFEAGLSEQQVRLISEGSGTYAIRFKSVEIWQSIKGFFGST